MGQSASANPLAFKLQQYIFNNLNYFRLYAPPGTVNCQSLGIVRLAFNNVANCDLNVLNTQLPIQVCTFTPAQINQVVSVAVNQLLSSGTFGDPLSSAIQAMNASVLRIGSGHTSTDLLLLLTSNIAQIQYNQCTAQSTSLQSDGTYNVSNVNCTLSSNPAADLQLLSLTGCLYNAIISVLKQDSTGTQLLQLLQSNAPIATMRLDTVVAKQHTPFRVQVKLHKKSRRKVKCYKIK